MSFSLLDLNLLWWYSYVQIAGDCKNRVGDAASSNKRCTSANGTHRLVYEGANRICHGKNWCYAHQPMCQPEKLDWQIPIAATATAVYHFVWSRSSERCPKGIAVHWWNVWHFYWPLAIFTHAKNRLLFYFSTDIWKFQTRMTYFLQKEFKWGKFVLYFILGPCQLFQLPKHCPKHDSFNFNSRIGSASTEVITGRDQV